MLNEAPVRLALAARGIEIPETTRFVAGLHNTTTDEITLYDQDELAASHQPDVATLKQSLVAAGNRARRERATHLGLTKLSDAELHAQVCKHANNWAQVRPEWGLANNAAFIVAPREHCRHLEDGTMAARRASKPYTNGMVQASEILKAALALVSRKMNKGQKEAEKGRV